MRLARVVLALLGLGFALTALAACGGGTGQLSVTLSADPHSSSGPYKPGDTPSFIVHVVNHGPADAPGVSVRVDLPGSFRYKSTEDPIGGLGDARTQPVDADVGVSDPQWGTWDLAAPNLNAQPSDVYSHVDITFTVLAGGSPDNYTLTGHAQGDNTAGSISSSPLPISVQAAPNLSLIATVSPTTLKGNNVATYRITVTNSGDGIANDVSLLITLPPVMGFQQSVTPFSGNGTRNNGIDPVKGSVEVYYSGFVLPPDSSGGPGIITVIFKATVVTKPATGRYPLSVQVTDADSAGVVDATVYLVNAAPVSVSGVSPSPSPLTSPTPGH